jgi:hypothetical protein
MAMPRSSRRSGSCIALRMSACENDFRRLVMSSRTLLWPRLSLAAMVTFALLTGAAAAQAQSNTISAAAPGNCITSVQTCATVPVQISRTDSTPLLAFSVTFTLSPELVLCSPPAITEGTYLSSWNSNTSFNVRDRGNGTYTADGTILGLSNCGPSAASGTLFNVRVTNAGGSGTGSVTITSVILRDCSNATLPSDIGSAASVNIDLTPVIVDPIPTQTVSETNLLTVTPNVTISSCATGPATWTATGLPTGASLNSSTGVVTWTPDCSAFENGPNYGPVTLTAHAVSGETGSASFSIHVNDNPGTVTVTATNPPSVEEQSPLAMSAPGATLAGCASGAVTWSISPAVPTGATFNTSSGVITWTPSCGQAGSYGPFTLTATAASGESGNASISLTVTHKAGTVTVAAIADPTIAETHLLTVTPSPTLTDCAAGPVSWTATGLPTGALIDGSTGVITWTPDCAAAETNGGLYGPVQVTAHAATGEMGSTSFSIHVTDTPGTVTVAAIPDPQTVAELSLLTVTPSAGLTGCAREPLTWTATGLPSGASIDPGTGVVTWTPDCAAAETNGGVYGPVTITAHAVEGESDSRSFSIHVSDTPVPVAAVTGLSAATVSSGNGSSGRTAITVSFTPPAGATSIEVYRAPFGNYPEYDDAPNAGATPTAPASYPPGAPWVLTSVTASGQNDTPATRDYWYYVAYAKNACGEVSPVSSVSGGALDYHLGDVSNGVTEGAGDNLVNTADISELGAHYGLTGGAVLPYNYLDVGPTSTNWVDGRPLTDDAIDFEDLVIFALDYGAVSAPQKLGEPIAGTTGGTSVLTLASPSAVSVGDVVTAKLQLHATGSVAAISTQLSWDPSVVEPTASAAGDWLVAQGGVALSAKPGSVDAAALGHALSGEGLLATVSFRVLAAGDPHIQLVRSDARDTKNQKLSVNLVQPSPAAVTPAVTQLAPAVPNPAAQNQSMAFAFSLAKGGPVDLSVFTVSGRLVKTLVHETRDPGNYRLTWSGLDEGGVRATAGTYYLRLSAPQGQFTRTLTLLK